MEASLDNLSLMDPRVQSDPFEFHRLVRETPGLYQMPETGFYLVSRYEDARAVLLNPAVFSNDLGGFHIQDIDDLAIHQTLVAEDGFGYVPTLQSADPPSHARHRSIAEQIFTAKNVKSLIPRIEGLAHELIDRFIERGSCEFVGDFCLPLTATILAEQMGLPVGDYATLVRWVDASVELSARRLTHAEIIENAKVQIAMRRFLAEALAKRREHPENDFLSYIITADQASDSPLTLSEQLSVATQLLMAGFETSMTALANGLLLLIENPDQMQELRADRGLLKTFIEEAMRHTTPVQGLPRRVLKDTELSGTLLPAGSVVMVRHAAANQDPDKFECPHQFDLHRKNASAHLAFGNGIHFCVGRLLARQEMLTAFGILLDRLGNIELARDLPQPRYKEDLVLRILRELPIRFSAL